MSVPIAAALTTPQLVRLLDAANVAVEDVAIQRATLDDVFMTLTEGEIIEADVEQAFEFLFDGALNSEEAEGFAEGGVLG